MDGCLTHCVWPHLRSTVGTWLDGATQSSVSFVTCGEHRTTFQIFRREKFSGFDAAPSIHGESFLLLLYRQTWSWDGSVNPTHPQQQSTHLRQNQEKQMTPPHPCPTPTLLVSDSRAQSSLSFAPLAESTASLDHQQRQGQRCRRCLLRSRDPSSHDWRWRGGRVAG